MDINTLPTTSGVYEIRINGCDKPYVGSTKNFRKRAYNHLWYLKAGKHGNSRLQRTYNKYCQSAEDITITVLEVVETGGAQSCLTDAEQKWIDFYTFQETLNLRPKAESQSGRKATPEQLARMSTITKRKFENAEYRDAHRRRIKAASNRPEVRARLSVAVRKSHARVEVRRKMSNSAKKKFSDPNYRAAHVTKMKQVYDSDPQMQWRLANSSAYKHPRAVEQVCKKTGELLTTHPSLAAAGVAIGKGKEANSNISRACMGKLPSAYGFKWRYVDQNPPAALE